MSDKFIELTSYPYNKTSRTGETERGKYLVNMSHVTHMERLDGRSTRVYLSCSNKEWIYLDVLETPEEIWSWL